MSYAMGLKLKYIVLDAVEVFSFFDLANWSSNRQIDKPGTDGHFGEGT